MSPEGKSALYTPGQNAVETGAIEKSALNSPAIKQLYEAASDISEINMADLLGSDPESKLDLSRYAQPFVLVTSIACWQIISNILQEHLPAMPNIISGHSLGEYTSLVIAGSLELEEALKLVYTRGILLDEESKKKSQTMLVVLNKSLSEIEVLCEKTGTEVANENSDDQFVIAGYLVNIDEAERLILVEQPQTGAMSKRIKINVGSHCSLAEVPAQEMAKHINAANIKDPKIPFSFIANVTGDYVQTAQEVKTQLIAQLTNRVLWRQTIRRMFEDGVTDFYEIGPQNILTKLTTRIAKHDGLEEKVRAFSTKQILHSNKFAIRSFSQR